MKKNKSTIILILVFFVGLSVMLYPTISDYVNQRNQSRAVASYAQDVDNMTDADYSAYFDAADAFNAQVAASSPALAASTTSSTTAAARNTRRLYSSTGRPSSSTSVLFSPVP